MRFASLGASNAANYAGAGKAVADSSARVFDTQRKTGPDYAGLSKVAMAAQSSENIAAARAEAEVAKAGISAMSYAKRSAIKAEYDIQKSKNDTKARMAGILPAIGAIAGDAFRKDPKPPPPELLVPPVKPEDVEYPEVDYSGAPERPAPITLPESGASTSTSSIAPSNGSTYSVDDLEKMVLGRVNDPGFARKFARIGMAESGGRPAIDTVQSGLDPNKSNEYSIGLWQVNTNAHADRIRNMGYTIEDMRKPGPNLDVALSIYRDQGLGAWGAFTNRSYLNY